MPSPQRQAELGIALAAVRQASRLCRRVQAGLDPRALTKGDRSPVTIADFGSQALICRALAEAFPEDPVIAEEDAGALREPAASASREAVIAQVQRQRPEAVPADVLDWIDHGNSTEHSPRFWTLDPIDGTKGFLRGDQYAVALALVIDGQVVLGVLGCPNLDAGLLAAGRLSEPDAERLDSGGSLLYGIPGEGAYLLPLEDPDARRIRLEVSARTDPARIRLCESVEPGHTAQGASARVASSLRVSVPPARIDSQAKYAAVAAGAAEAYLRLPTKPGYIEKIWDHGAGVAVVTAAGGRVTDIHGRPLDFSRGSLLTENRGVVVTNGRVHAPVLAAVDRALAG